MLGLHFSPDSDLIIFDEIHKYKNWKNHIKGFYDSQQSFKTLVTGSARLDLYRKGGDSMMRRCHYHRLYPFSLAREDLSVTHRTLSKWMDILENFYYCYRIYPFQSTMIKSLKKEPKLFLWDYSEISDPAARFENLIASHLLKFTHYLYG